MPSQAPRQIRQVVGENIRAARLAINLTQFELGSRVGTDSTSVSRWESGRVMPGLDTLQALADVLKRDVPWFYTDHDREVPAA